MKPSVSVIVLVWNGQPYLEKCLTALLAQDYDPFEVIVVDNASTDDSAGVARRFAPRVRLIQNEYNFGYAGGNNLGLRAASGEIVVLLNQDTEVQPGWLAAIVETFLGDEAIGIVGCKALYPDGRTLQHAGGKVRADDAFAYHLGQGEEDRGQHDLVADVDYVTGAAFAVHRRVLERIGPLDERFHPAFYEETDYCYQARRTGFRVVYQPRAVLLHHETTSLPENSYPRVAAFHRNRVRFVLRHWDANALETFVAAERRATAEALWIDDAVARGRAYWINLAYLPHIDRERQEKAQLGPALTTGQWRHLADSLQALRQQAYRRVDALLGEEPQPGGADVAQEAPAQETPPQTAVGAGTEAHTLPDDRRDTAQSPRETLAHLQDLLQQLADTHALREHRFVSHIPVLGPLIARFRTLWLSVAARWYVLPVLQQQSSVNDQVVQILAEIAQLMQTLSSDVETLAGRVGDHDRRLLTCEQHVRGLDRKVRHQLAFTGRMHEILAEDDAVMVEIAELLLSQSEENNDRTGRRDRHPGS